MLTSDKELELEVDNSGMKIQMMSLGSHMLTIVYSAWSQLTQFTFIEAVSFKYIK